MSVDEGAEEGVENWGDFFPDLGEPGIPVYGVRMIGFIDENGNEALIWDVHGDFNFRSVVADLDFLKLVFNNERLNAGMAIEGDGDGEDPDG